MSRVYVGNLDPRVSERDLEDEFRIYGVLRSVWVARRPPGYAFIDFDDRRDALDAIRTLDGKNGWHVELSHNSKGGGWRGRGGGDDMNCYECGEPGHFARECRSRIGSRGLGNGRRRSPSPRRRRSPSYGRRFLDVCIELWHTFHREKSGQKCISDFTLNGVIVLMEEGIHVNVAYHLDVVAVTADLRSTVVVAVIHHMQMELVTETGEYDEFQQG